MTFAGKKLQDIYDGGSQALSDEESAAKERLRKSKDAHLQDRKDREEGDVGKINAKYGEYETELRGLMTKTVDHIKEAMEDEVKETERHVQYLCGELKLVADKLRSSIKDLQHSHEANINYASSTATDQFESAVEESHLELERNENATTKHLKAHGTFVLNSLQQKLDHCLWESRGDEKQFSGNLFKSYMQRTNSIDTHFSSLLQKMSADLQPNLKALETASTNAQSEVSKDSAQVLEKIENASVETEAYLKQLFQQTLDEHTHSLNQHLSNMTEDLGRVHDGTTSQLTEQTREHSTNLIVASGEAQEALKVRCKTMRTQVDTTMDSFTQRLDERLKQVLVGRDNLEQEKAKIFQSIREELTRIRDEYETRLNTLKSESMTKVNTIVQDTEQEITSARERCESKMASDAAHVKSELERAISQFLDLLSQRKKEALAEIAQAADNQEQTPEQKAAEAQRLRQKRTKRDDGGQDQ